MDPRYIRGTWQASNKTETADTVIVQVVPPGPTRTKAKIASLSYISAGTAHTVTVMKALARTTATAAVASGGTTLNIAAKTFLDDTLAASDYIVYRGATSGLYYAALVSAVSTLALTIPAAPEAIANASPVWLFGTATQTNGQQTILKPTISTRTQYPQGGDGVVAQAGYLAEISDVKYYRSGFNDPMIVHSTNATAAGTIELLSVIYTSV